MAIHDTGLPLLGAPTQPWKVTTCTPDGLGVGRHGNGTGCTLRVLLPDGTAHDYITDVITLRSLVASVPLPTKEP